MKRFIPDLRARALGGTLLFLLTGGVFVAQRVKANDYRWFVGELSFIAAGCFFVAWVVLAGIGFGKPADRQDEDYGDKA